MQVNPQVFSEMMIPEGLDKDILIDNLVMEISEMSIIYSKPETLQLLIKIWSRRRVFIWTELYKTLLYKYDPIANYDRVEERVYRDDHKGSSGENRAESLDGSWKNVTNNTGHDEYNDTATTTRTPDLEEHITEGGTTHATTDTNEDRKHKVWGFNSEISADSYQDIGNSDSVTDGTTSNTSNRTNTGTETIKTVTKGDSDSKQDNTTDNSHTDDNREKIRRENADINFHAEKMRARGNIGVTTTQQMIEQQRKIVDFDIYKYIIDDFKSQFCLMVY